MDGLAELMFSWGISMDPSFIVRVSTNRRHVPFLREVLSFRLYGPFRRWAFLCVGDAQPAVFVVLYRREWDVYALAGALGSVLEIWENTRTVAVPIVVSLAGAVPDISIPDEGEIPFKVSVKALSLKEIANRCIQEGASAFVPVAVLLGAINEPSKAREFLSNVPQHIRHTLEPLVILAFKHRGFKEMEIEEGLGVSVRVGMESIKEIPEVKVLLEEARKEGYTDGLKDGIRSTIREILQVKFGIEGLEIYKAIMDENDVENLRNVALLASVAQTPQELKEKLSKIRE